MQNLKKNWFVISKMTRIWWTLILALKSLKHLHFDDHEKYVMFYLEKTRGVTFHDTRVMQNLKKNWLVVWKITWGIWQIFTRALVSWDSKLGLLWGTFIPSRKCMSLKFTGELCVITMKKDVKFEKELTSSKLASGI